MVEILATVVVRKALDVSTSMSTIKSRADLEVLVSRCSTEAHSFISS